MVKGLDTFQKYFADYEEQYVLIGGAACDILFESNEVNFRATRDLDMVLIVEALTPEFGEKFWEFIADGKYRNKATNGSNPQFYRLWMQFIRLSLLRKNGIEKQKLGYEYIFNKWDRVEIHGPFLMQKIRKEGIPVAGAAH